MKKISLCILLVVSLSVAHAEPAPDPSENLPEDAKTLAEKLSAWETEKRDEVEREIRAKRKELIPSMNKYAQIETKSGNLDGALAIRNFIDHLQTGESETREANGIEEQSTTEESTISLKKLNGSP